MTSLRWLRLLATNLRAAYRATRRQVSLEGEVSEYIDQAAELRETYSVIRALIHRSHGDRAEITARQLEEGEGQRMYIQRRADGGFNITLEGHERFSELLAESQQAR